MMDLTGLFRVWNPQYKSWSVFGQVGGARRGAWGARGWRMPASLDRLLLNSADPQFSRPGD